MTNIFDKVKKKVEYKKKQAVVPSYILSISLLYTKDEVEIHRKRERQIRIKETVAASRFIANKISVLKEAGFQIRRREELGGHGYTQVVYDIKTPNENLSWSTTLLTITVGYVYIPREYCRDYGCYIGESYTFRTSTKTTCRVYYKHSYIRLDEWPSKKTKEELTKILDEIMETFLEVNEQYWNDNE